MAWWESPLILVPAGAVSAAGVAYLVSWLGTRKTGLERREKIASQEADVVSLRIQTEANELHAKIEAQRLAAAELVRQEVLAADLRKAQAETAKTLADMANKQDAMAALVTQTHDLTNSARTAMLAIEQGLRTEITAEKLAASNAAAMAAVELRAAQDAHRAALAAKDLELSDLRRQMTTLALSAVPPALVPLAQSLLPASPITPAPAPTPVVITDPHGTPAPLPLNVIVKEPAP
jgi:hypothetical protein